MSSEGSRLWLLLICAGLSLGGCAGGPSGAAQTSTQSQSNNDEYDGWLFKSLTGRKASAETKPATSATSPQSTATGPLVPGPSSNPSRIPASTTAGPELVPASAELPLAGPPPSIPSELPPPPAEAVSIKDAKLEEEKKKGFEISDLAPENVYKNMKKAAGYGPDENIARAAMQEGKTLFDEKKYKEAVEKFATAADRWPDSPLEEDALFLKGESEFFCDLYPKAHDTYGGLLKKYSNTRHLDTVMRREFAIGQYWEQLYDAKPTWPITPNVTDNNKPLFDTFGYSVQAYERIRMNDPTGPLADDSLMAMGNAYLRRGQFENAAYNYDLLIKEYPNSDHQAKAHMLGLQAKMRVYQGAMYLADPLNDAKRIADQTLTQFGDKLGEQRERVMQARGQIIEEKANREFAVGQYYDKNKYYGAAKMYYKGVVDEYPGTQKAKEAQARLEEIRDLPDSPPDRFKWLSGVFGAERP